MLNQAISSWRRVALPGAALFLIAALLTRTAVAQDFSTTISVDTSADLGSVDPAIRPSAFAGWASQQNFDTFTGEATTLGLVRMHVEQALTSSTSLADYKNRLKTMGGTWKNVEAKGGTIVICLARMPRWLSSKSSRTPIDDHGFLTYEAAPPRDYNTWAQVVQATVQRFSGDLKLNPLYELWNEPDLTSYWSGSTDDYFKLYRYFVLGARQANPNAKVGGPTTSGFNVKINDNKPNNLITDFLSYCAATPLPELGYARLPVDFICWHQYGSNPFTGWVSTATAIRNLVISNGYPSTTPLIVDEWNYISSSNWEDNTRDTENDASFIAANIHAMSLAGITQQCIAALEDYQPGTTSPFHGDYGIMTNATRLRKPAYNAVMAFDYLSGGDELQPTVQGASLISRVPTLEATASVKPNGQIAIVVWNNIISVGAVAGVSLQASGTDPTQFAAMLKAQGTTADAWVTAAIADPTMIDSLNVSAAQKANLHVAVNDAAQSQVLAVTPLAANLSLGNLPAARYQVQRYVVDAATSNSYRTYNAAIANGQASADAVTAAHGVEALQKVEDYQTDAGQGVNPFPIAPYSVQVLVLTPVAAP